MIITIVRDIFRCHISRVTVALFHHFFHFRFLCDNDTDCVEGEDELQENCPTTPLPCEFACSNGSCIPRSRVCDYFKDCPMGEDEGNCASCPSGTWRCSSNGRCIQLSLLCDEAPDCPDGEDESSFCPAPIITTPTAAIKTTALTGTTPFTIISTPPPICVYNGTTYQVLYWFDF